MAICRACLGAFIVAFAAGCSLPQNHRAPGQPGHGELTTLPRHDFHRGEVFTYVFENTEARYSTVQTDGVPRPTDLTSVEEITASVKVEILSSGLPTTKRVTVSDVAYRNERAGDLSTGLPFGRAEDLEAGFPRSFSYTYHVNKSDGEVEAQLAELFKGVRGGRIGSFLYYKMQDFHAFQGSADLIASSNLQRGHPHLNDEITIPLADGVFHNAKNLVYYHRNVTLDGVRHALVKSSVMGNWYEGPSVRPLTNYQYTFVVAIDGRVSGIVTFGNMDETVYITDPSTKTVSLLQRMVSVNLVSSAQSE